MTQHQQNLIAELKQKISEANDVIAELNGSDISGLSVTIQQVRDKRRDVVNAQLQHGVRVSEAILTLSCSITETISH
jgi:hypothetical protein